MKKAYDRQSARDKANAASDQAYAKGFADVLSTQAFRDGSAAAHNEIEAKSHVQPLPTARPDGERSLSVARERLASAQAGIDRSRAALAGIKTKVAACPTATRQPAPAAKPPATAPAVTNTLKASVCAKPTVSADDAAATQARLQRLAEELRQPNHSLQMALRAANVRELNKWRK